MRGPGAALIHSLKYEGATSIAPFIARRMAPAWPAAAGDTFDCLLPVPLHSRRMRERGYNQSGLLAEELTKITGVITAPNLLVRALHTGPQVGLEGRERWKNVRGAFTAPFPRAVEGRHVMLIDDVATTGATLRACADALLGCGAERVGALVGALA
jgi:ComF family protein